MWQLPTMSRTLADVLSIGVRNLIFLDHCDGPTPALDSRFELRTGAVTCHRQRSRCPARSARAVLSLRFSQGLPAPLPTCVFCARVTVSDSEVLYRSETAVQTPNPTWRPIAADGRLPSAVKVATVRVVGVSPQRPEYAFVPLRASTTPLPRAGDAHCSHDGPSTGRDVASFDLVLDVNALEVCDPGWHVSSASVAAPTVPPPLGIGSPLAAASSKALLQQGATPLALPGASQPPTLPTRKIPVLLDGAGDAGDATAPSSSGTTTLSVWDCLPNNTLLVQLRDYTWCIGKTTQSRLVNTFSFVCCHQRNMHCLECFIGRVVCVWDCELARVVTLLVVVSGCVVVVVAE